MVVKRLPEDSPRRGGPLKPRAGKISDKERLDWLSKDADRRGLVVRKKGQHLDPYYFNIRNWHGDETPRVLSLRQSIDATMRAEAKARGRK